MGTWLSPHKNRLNCESPHTIGGLSGRVQEPCLSDYLLYSFSLQYTNDSPAAFAFHVDIITEEFLYQLSIGFSPLFVALSSTYAHRFKNSSCSITRVNLPVMAR